MHRMRSGATGPGMPLARRARVGGGLLAARRNGWRFGQRRSWRMVWMSVRAARPAWTALASAVRAVLSIDWSAG